MTIINRCPECKDANVSKSKDLGGTWSMVAWIVLAIATFGVSLLFTPFLRTLYRCRKCGVEWK
jgi:hypothetical protein